MSRALRVLYIVAGFSLETLGGVERYAFDLGRALVRRGVEVGIAGIWQFGDRYEREWMKRLNAEGIATFAGSRKDDAAPLRSLLRSIAVLRKALRGQAFPIVHSQQEFGDVVAIALRGAVRARALVRSVHNDIEWRHRPARRLLLSHALLPLAFQTECGISPAIVGRLNSRPLAKLLHKRALLIPNAVDLGRFAGLVPDRARSRRALGWPEESLIIGSIGRLNEQKGYADLIAAVAHVRVRWPNLRAYIIGEGELRQALQRQIAQLDLQDTVMLTGPLSNVTDAYAAMDVFVSSSLWEGLPTVVLEAMAMGTPVVGTDVGGTPDLITHERTGLLAPAADPSALAHAIERALSERSFMRDMAVAAKQRAAEYSLDSVAAQLVQLYAQYAP